MIYFTISHSLCLPSSVQTLQNYSHSTVLFQHTPINIFSYMHFFELTAPLQFLELLFIPFDLLQKCCSITATKLNYPSSHDLLNLMLLLQTTFPIYHKNPSAGFWSSFMSLTLPFTRQIGKSPFPSCIQLRLALPSRAIQYLSGEVTFAS